MVGRYRAFSVGSIRCLEMDLRHLHHSIRRQPPLRAHSRPQGHEKGQCGRVLSGQSGCSFGEYSVRLRQRVQAFSGIRRVDKEQERSRVHCLVLVLQLPM